MKAKWIVDSLLPECMEKRQARIQELEAELDQLSKEKDALELAINVLKEEYGEDEWEVMCGGQLPPIYPYSDLVASDDEDIPFTHKARNAAYKVLLEHRPMHRSRLLEAVQAEGLEIVGRDPAGLLTSYLSPDARFMSVPSQRGYWTLTQEPTVRRPIAPDSEGV